MYDPTLKLKELKLEKEFFIGIDSDGCVFDSMEIKQKECFCPQFINHFGLQPVSKYARETWEFVNLYSKNRGINRFHAIIKAVDLLAKRPEVKSRNALIPSLEGIKDWTKRETKLSNTSLKAEIEKPNAHPDLKIIYDWSIDVNQTVEKIVRNVPPFPYVKECLEKMIKKADIIVVSQTPTEALEREWQEHNINGYVKIIAGQELGTKKQHIAFATKSKYPSDKMLMIGDAPGDLKAAKANKSLFYPIIPGKEEESWKLLYQEALDKFFNGRYTGKYETKLINRFNKYLPENPIWEVK